MSHLQASFLASNNIDIEDSLPLVKAAAAQSSLPPRRVPAVKRTLTGTRVYFFVLHILVVLFAGLFLRELSDNAGTIPIAGRTWSPAQEFVEYEVNDEHATDEDRQSGYSGPPTKENDAAWIALIEPIYFNASWDELVAAGESTENIAQLSSRGYPASLGVYHELHCLRQLRFWLYREHYYPNLTEAQFSYSQRHLVMCHGSTALYSFKWKDPGDDRPVPQSNSKMICVNWSSIHNWALTRKISMSPELVRPGKDDQDGGAVNKRAQKAP
ncbi:hypothetical protein HIM_04082 [Hirsutella minnesotensis 3608]|uniref:Uncharacterized protein n=1 Tax=Hirsutella minnesotensis 3608 TaxID=1043627 RepID=A0A0F7ZVC1_9HYPO|nr:hypothetical protein HIM_04082 [Hirsutella minnesotensis 3608]